MIHNKRRKVNFVAHKKKENVASQPFFTNNLNITLSMSNKWGLHLNEYRVVFFIMHKFYHNPIYFNPSSLDNILNVSSNGEGKSEENKEEINDWSVF